MTKTSDELQTLIRLINYLNETCMGERNRDYIRAYLNKEESDFYFLALETLPPLVEERGELIKKLEAAQKEVAVYHATMHTLNRFEQEAADKKKRRK